ncbi:hypothetical protein CMI37_13615 [Candidatus Pacearchaeota archaeon]|nr:hypothetical protein [Candidatus Pacearchaeota archaeon]
MFINPKTAVKKGWIENVKDSWIQPNAIDISADKLFKMNLATVFYIGDDKKTHRVRQEVQAGIVNNTWELEPGSYDFVSNVYVNIPEGMVGWVRVRSTFNRNGVNVGSGFYDSGYKGPICGTLYVTGITRMKQGTPVGQFIFAESDSEGIYAGGYNAEKGELPTHIK